MNTALKSRSAIALLVTVAVAGVVVGSVMASKKLAKLNHYGILTIKVTPTNPQFAAKGTDTGPFLVQGNVTPVGLQDIDGNPVDSNYYAGYWNCWGWMINTGGAACVNDEYDLAALGGKIFLQGNLSDDTRAIVGGTGIFRNSRGEATFQQIDSEPGAFLVRFEFLDQPDGSDFVVTGQ